MPATTASAAVTTMTVAHVATARARARFGVPAWAGDASRGRGATGASVSEPNASRPSARFGPSPAARPAPARWPGQNRAILRIVTGRFLLSCRLPVAGGANAGVATGVVPDRAGKPAKRLLDSGWPRTPMPSRSLLSVLRRVRGLIG